MTSNKRLHGLSSCYQKFICWRSQSPSLSIAMSEILASGFRDTVHCVQSRALLEQRRFSSAFFLLSSYFWRPCFGWLNSCQLLPPESIVTPYFHIFSHLPIVLRRINLKILCLTLHFTTFVYWSVSKFHFECSWFISEGIDRKFYVAPNSTPAAWGIHLCFAGTNNSVSEFAIVYTYIAS